jgi:hypothetical protein
LRKADLVRKPYEQIICLQLCLIMGAVNFFGDVTYEGGGSVNCQYLGSLGATAAIISIAAGGGEPLGYALRSVTGSLHRRSCWPRDCCSIAHPEPSAGGWRSPLATNQAA